MSTSEQTLVHPVAGSGAPELPGSAGLAAGVLSPAELARMANAMFNALPDELQQPAVSAARAVMPANSAFSGNPYSAVPGPTVPAAPGMLAGFAELQPGAFVATPDHSVPPDVHSNASAPAAPVSSQAGFGAAPALPTDPAFAFLADARPLFVSPAGEPALQNSPPFSFGSAVPSEESFASIPSSLFTDLPPSQLAGAQQPPAPAVPGAFGVVDSSAIPTFSFLEDVRPLFSNPSTLPGPVPADAASSVGNPF